jgi:ArsR family transcriptional regulator, arsenate/arsenite/antimonite-responsive transcriptional repressor
MEMDEPQALAAFAALGQEHRLRALRVLVKAGPEGLASGVLANAIGVSASTISFHLKELQQAGLIRSRRAGRSMIYSVAYPVLSGVVEFLMTDCCQGHPEVCVPALAALSASCIPESEVDHA